MSTAGIDYGTTLAKVYWKRDGYEQYALIDSPSRMEILSDIMRKDGVWRVRVTGTGSANFRPTDFAIVRSLTDAVQDEITLQALGVRSLLERTVPSPMRMLVVSIGTGTSYTTVFGRRAKRSRLGNAIGGGFVLGLGRRLGASTFDDIEAAAAKGTPPDLLVKDALPKTDGTPLGELVLAHFGKAKSTFEDDCAGIISCLATQIARDIAILGQMPFFPKDIVVIGTTVSRSPTLRRYLKMWEPLLKRRLHFPAGGEFAAAIGARADIAQ